MAFRAVLSNLRILSSSLSSAKLQTMSYSTSQNLPEKTFLVYRSFPPGTPKQKDHQLQICEFKEGILFTQCVAIDISNADIDNVGVFSAFAINYNIKLLGAVFGVRKYSKIANLEYFAIREGMHLDGVLRQRGLHDGIGHVRSYFEHPLDHVKEIEKGYHFGDLCFRKDDEMNTCEMVIGGEEEICEKLPQVLLKELEKIKIALEKKKRDDCIN